MVTVKLTDFSSGFKVVFVELEVLSSADENLVGQEQRGRVHHRWDRNFANQIKARRKRQEWLKLVSRTAQGRVGI